MLLKEVEPAGPSQPHPYMADWLYDHLPKIILVSFLRLKRRLLKAE